jgi:hypothetical protein
MIDEEREDHAAPETLPDTPLHAYKEEDRHDEIEGDVEKLKSGDPEQSQRQEIEDESEDSGEHIEAPPKH